LGQPDRGEVFSVGRNSWWQASLALPFIGLVFGPLYARHSPELFGLAFFYPYELALVLATVVLSWFVYRTPAEPAEPLRVMAEPEEPRFTRDGVPVRVRVYS
jgi:Protein of unknown function (DUF3311)